jgi:hypothetical protein
MCRHAGTILILAILVLILATVPQLSESRADEDLGAVPPPQSIPSDLASQKLRLSQAVMGEKVENLLPVRPAIAFSVGIGQVYCFTAFDPVPQPSVVFHRWFHRDELSTQTRLRLYPPKWSTYSVIQLRETDKGPWRVEISDQEDHVLHVLRFSITD